MQHNNGSKPGLTVNLKRRVDGVAGPVGAPGPTGPQGPQGPAGAPGPVGAQIWNAFVPTFGPAYTVAAFTPSNGIQITRIQVEVSGPPSKCSTNSTLVLSNGSTPYALPVTGGMNDSGPIALVFTAGTPLTLAVTSPSKCAAVAANGNVTVQYQSH